LEDEREKARQLSEGNAMWEERCKKLQDELMELRVEHQKTKKQLQEEEARYKAERDRHAKTIKEISSGGQRAETPSTAPTQTKSAAAADDNHYDEDFDDEEE
jgi:hypothetical protein